MRILVVYCHPVPDSFCAAVRDTAIGALQRAGHETRLLDLYAIGFDPVMQEAERRAYNEMCADQHPLPEHAEHLAWAQALVFVYPTWWYGLPAMLKGWLDRVWTPAITFDINMESGVIKPLMTHVKKVGVITTCGAPMWWSYMVGHPGMRTLTRGIRALCAKRCKTIFMAHYLMDTSTAESRGLFLSKVDAKMARF
ncbi:MAG: NAD(P)H-dependent oxidoreductase [Pseudomonadota bacterium]